MWSFCFFSDLYSTFDERYVYDNNDGHQVTNTTTTTLPPRFFYHLPPLYQESSRPLTTALPMKGARMTISSSVPLVCYLFYFIFITTNYLQVLRTTKRIPTPMTTTTTNANGGQGTGSRRVFMHLALGKFFSSFCFFYISIFPSYSSYSLHYE